MTRPVYLLFGFVAYLIFFVTFLYLIAFVGNLPWVEVTVDRGGPAASLGTSIVIDLALIALFGLQHSIMARRGFKAAWTKLVPVAVERSTFVLIASGVLILMFLLWRPITDPVWTVTNQAAATVLWVLFALGWLIVLLSTFLISHFELFGLKQVWDNMRGGTVAEPVFRQPFFYRFIRHPLYAGFIIAFWATPAMTVGHLLFAVGMSFYMLIAIRFEERDLVRMFGTQYVEYRVRVGMLIPRMRRTS
jgi:protein-S-isoprenylcysteine O-methyltransferase Ste14